MTTRRYYQAALSLPLLVPLLAALLGLVIPERRSGVSGVMGVLVYSGILGGLPYAVLAAGLLWWWRERGDREIRTSIRLAPLMMVPLQVVPLIVYSISSETTGWTRIGESVLFFGGFVLVLGYLYVLLVEAGFHLGTRQGWIHPTPDAVSRAEPAVGAP